MQWLLVHEQSSAVLRGNEAKGSILLKLCIAGSFVPRALNQGCIAGSFQLVCMHFYERIFNRRLNSHHSYLAPFMFSPVSRPQLPRYNEVPPEHLLHTKLKEDVHGISFVFLCSL